jgi:hypothetical protein
MTKSRVVRESVINGYLNGKSFDEISNDNSVAKGSVYNIIRDWINHIGIPDIEELRGFSVMVRKSGINIKQCAQSFRFIQILANFGINDEIDSTYTADIILKNKGKNDHILTSRDNFYYFIEYMYNYCKNTDIKSTDIVGWMQDLIDFSSLLFDDEGNSTNSFARDINEFGEWEDLDKNKTFPYRKPGEPRNIETKVQIPLTSKLSGYIEQKKLELQQLDINKKKLLQENEELEEQKNTISSRLTNLEIKESQSLTYLNWFNTLKDKLWNTHEIRLEEEFDDFIKVFTDFKYYRYDTHEIVKEYKQFESLRAEKKSIEDTVKLQTQTRDGLKNEIERLKQNEKYSKQSIRIVSELYHAGFGFEELWHLKNTVVEIAEANNIGYYDAGMRLLKDIENQYDYKLGFESKIKELEAKLKKLEAEHQAYNDYLQSKDTVSKALPFLYRYGVTDEDIINMTAIVKAYAKGNIIFNPSLQPENMIDKDKVMEKTHYWKSLIHEIKNLGNINSQTAYQRSYLEVIKKEIDRLYSQRQKLNEQTLLSGQLLNSLNAQLSSFMEFIKQFILFVNNTNKKMYIVYQPLIFINVTTDSDSKDDSNINSNERP